MKRTEFIDDVVLFGPEELQTYDDADDSDEPFDPSSLDCETWHDWYSEHLLNMYMSLVQYDEDMGLRCTKNLTFNSFCNFMYAHRK